MKLQEVLQKTAEHFRKKNLIQPRFEAELLIAGALNLKRIDLYLQFERPLSEAELDLLRNSVRRRSEGEPLAYILGNMDFFKANFFVNSSVLIPRPETEVLVQLALEKTSLQNGTILDLGCGSGAIGLSLLREKPDFFLKGVDISCEAIEVSKKNAERLSLKDRSDFICLDAVEFLKNQNQKYEIVCANPPYIEPGDLNLQKSVKDFEPALALFANEEGFELVRNWFFAAIEKLQPQGLLIFETGHNHAEKALKMLALAGVPKFELYKDFSGHDRGFIVYG